MKQGLLCLNIIAMMLLFCLVGCSEEGKGDYKGVSELISDRNQARSAIKKKSGSTGDFDQNQPAADSQSSHQQKKPDPAPEEITPAILYEEKVKIFSESSDKMIAKGIAYINKQGQIVRLKIVNE